MSDSAELLHLLDVAQLDVVRNLQQANEPDLIAELIAVYFEEVGPMVGELRAAHARADCAGVARAAHALKGASSNLGIRRVFTSQSRGAGIA